MIPTRGKVFYGWFVVAGCALIAFGVSGSQFSFGVFLKPMTEDFGWSRASLSLAFGSSFMLSGLLRPVAGYLADNYNPKTVALSGVALVGSMLMLIPLINTLLQLHLIFAIMSVGITLGSGPTLTKVISSWFYRNRGLILGLVSGGGSTGAIILVPATSLFLVLFHWRHAYFFLGMLLLFLVIPIGYILIRNRPIDIGLKPQGIPDCSETLTGDEATFSQAIQTSFFWKLTFGYFV